MLSTGDSQAVLDGCEHLRDWLLFALLLDTGLCIGEALGLQHEDIALAERQVSVIPRRTPTGYGRSAASSVLRGRRGMLARQVPRGPQAQPDLPEKTSTSARASSARKSR